MPPTTRNVRIFVLVTLVCVGVAIGYTLFSARRHQQPSGVPTAAIPRPSPSAAPPPRPALVPAPSPPPFEQPAETAARGDAPPAPVTPPNAGRGATRAGTQSDTFLVAVNVRDSPELGTVEFAALGSLADRQQTTLHCERIYFARDIGICLSREIKFFSARTIATMIDATFRPLFDVRADGIPSRARISPDQRYAAFTVFVTGHSYSDAQLSTATLLIDLKGRTTVANLEEFAVLQDGSAVKSPDFNYWGVTFERDSNFFYATLRMRGSNYLVRGDVNARTINVIYQGVECPSLSPDGKRIAFKKGISRGDWRLTVLELATMKETPLAETRSVDDQVEWLDNEHILYAVTDPTPWMSIKMVPADGTGEPRVFAKGASSPAVVRRFRH
jgi:hypothetical protein